MFPKAYNKIQKVLAVILGVAVFFTTVSTMSVFAFDTNYETLFEIDFEDGYSGYPEGGFKNDKNINRLVDTGDFGYNTAVKIPSSAVNLNLDSVEMRTLEVGDYTLSFDFMAQQTNLNGWAIELYNTAGTDVGRIMVCGNGTLSFKNGGWANPSSGTDGIRAAYTANTWHTIDIVVTGIDTADPRINYYVDGNYVNYSYYKGGMFKRFIIFPGPFGDDALIDEENQAIYIDNVRVSYNKGDVFGIKKTMVDGNEVRFDFSNMIDTKIAQVKLYACDTGKEVSVNEVVTKGRYVTLKAGTALSGTTQYVAVFPEGIKSPTGKMLKNRYCYFRSEAQEGSYIENAEFIGIDGVSYGALQDIPIVLDKLVISGRNLSAAGITPDDITFTDGIKECSVSDVQLIDGKLYFNVDVFLNKDTEYTLTIDSGAFPVYTAKFKTRNEDVSGFFTPEFVSGDGVKITDISDASGKEVHILTKLINTYTEDEKVVMTIASYKNNNGILCLNCIGTKEITVPASSIVKIGPDEAEKVKCTIPEDADVVKAFIWGSDSAMKPKIEPGIIGEDATEMQTEKTAGVSQQADGTILLTVKNPETETGKAQTVSVAVIKKGASYDNNAVYANQLKTDDNGELSVAFSIANESGEYVAEIAGDNGIRKTFDFIYVNIDEYNELAGKIDKAVAENDIEAFTVLYENNFAALGIEKGLFDSAKPEQTAKIIFDKLKNKPVTMSGDWQNGVSEVSCSAVIAATANGGVSNIFDYADILKLSEHANWEWFSKEFVTEIAQKNMTERQKGNYITEKEFYDKLTESYVLAIVEYSDGIANLREVLSNFHKEIGIKSTAKNATYQSLMHKNFKNYEELKDEFERLEKKNSNSGSSGGSSGGGGGSYSGGGNATVSGKLNKLEFEDTIKNDSLDEIEQGTIHEDIFTDLEGYDWARQSIVSLAELKIVTGKTNDKFYPADSVTREEFAAMLVRAFIEEAAEEVEIVFTDVDKNAWYAEYIEKAFGAGVVTGKSDEEFGIGEEITRQDMVVMAYRAAKYSNIIIEDSVSTEKFADDSVISDYAKDAVYVMKDAGVINGVTKDNYNPLGNATRAEAAKVIFRLLNL